ncbi:Crp/Fnr family transcriptional regulator [Cohnella abietis]|uniref:Crp/Fnr family transcriptional regulator n=1 Tax=Cohnella abietis TaxID=2507935 RepID=A0A3T1CY14_9BACL|nr:Crp/Fnr family transcriptional regulator [Cohnella abietis]BBI30757.1 Crp/Fnr family transcriptional regulator [Cohnella abietis]
MYSSVLDTSFFKGVIDSADDDFVIGMFVERHYPKGSVVFQQGDEGREMYVIKSGTLKIYRQDQGREIVLGHQFSGEAIGELEMFHYDNKRLASVATMEKTTLWMIRKADLDKLALKYPVLLRKALYIVSERLSQANRKIEYLSFLDVRVRVANILLDLNSNFGIDAEQGRLIQFRVSQQHLANTIGAGRESVARVLLELQKENLIHIANKDMYIVDLPRLERLAGPESEPQEERKWHSSHKYMI